MASSPEVPEEEHVPLSGGGREQHMGSCYSSKTKDGQDSSATNMPGSRPKPSANQTKGLRYPGTSKGRGSASLEETTPMVVNANLRRSNSSLSNSKSSSQSLDNKNANKQTNNASTSSAVKAAPETKTQSRFGFGMLRRKDDENSNKTSSQTSVNSQSSNHGGSMEKIAKKPDKGPRSSPLVESKNRNNLNDSRSTKSTNAHVIHRSSPASVKRPVSAEYKIESKALKSERCGDVQGAKSGAISSQSCSRLPVGGRGPLLSKLQTPKVKAQPPTDHFAAKNISPYPSPRIPRNLPSKSAAKPAASRPPSKVHNPNVESTYNQHKVGNEEAEKSGTNVQQEKVEENGNIVCEDTDKKLSSEPAEEPGTGSVKDTANQDNVSTTSSVQNLVAQAKRVSLTLNGSERFTPDSLPDTPFNKRAPLATFDSSVEGSSFASLLSDDLMLDYEDDEELEKTLCKSLSAASTPGEEKSILQQFAMAQRKSPGDERSVLQQFALLNRKMKPRSRSVEALRKKSLGKSPLTIDSTSKATINNGADSDIKVSDIEEVDSDSSCELKKEAPQVVSTEPVEETCVAKDTVDVEAAPVIEEEVVPAVQTPVENRPKTLQLDLTNKAGVQKPKDTDTEKKVESKLSAPKTVKESRLQKKTGLAQPGVKSGVVQPAVKSGIVQPSTKSVEKPEKNEKSTESSEKPSGKTDKGSATGRPPMAGGSLTRKGSYPEKKAPLRRSATEDSTTRGRSHTLSELNQLMQETSASKAPHLRTRSQSSPLKPPRPRSVSAIDDEDYVQMDGYNYRHIMQDVTTFKTMLHKLKRQLQDDEQSSPFEVESYGRLPGYRGTSFGSEGAAPGGSVLSLSDAGSLKRQRYRDAGSFSSITSSVTSFAKDELAEENMSLRHEVAVLQRQLEDKERTIKLLQQQMTKYTCIDLDNPGYQSTATQTDEDVHDNKTSSKKVQKGTIPQKGQIPQKTHVSDILDEVTRRSNEGAENFRNKLNAVEDTFTSMTDNLRSAHRSFSQTSLNKLK